MLNISNKSYRITGNRIIDWEKIRVPGNYRFLNYYAKDDISVT